MQVRNIARRTALAIAWFGVLAVAQAHHSFAMFDRTRTVPLSGTVRAFSWQNPHAFVWINVPGPGGKPDTWAVEFAGGPNVLLRSGWTRDTLHKGDALRVRIHPLRDGRMGGVLIDATLADGRKLGTEILPDTPQR